MSLSAKRAGDWRTGFIMGYVLVALLLSTVWLYFLLGPVSQAMEARQREGLVSVANATEVALETSELPVEDILERVASSDGLRLTLISHDGEVLADSSGTVDLGSHAERPEVATALGGSLGFDRRTSESDGIEYLYVAVPSDARAEGAVLRISMPVTQAHAAVMQFKWTSFALLATTFVLAAGAALYSFSRASAPVSRLERVRTDFVANASHELKTPVAGIRLLSESISAASEEGNIEVAGQFARQLSHESERLQSLITDLMDLSRLEDEAWPALGSETCDLSSVVATSFETRRMRASEAGLTFTLDDQVPIGQTCRVSMSVANATLMVDNLIDNAIAYTEQGGVRVRLSLEGHTAVFEVSDTGIGIPPRDQDRIFERFYRVDTTRSRETGGTGLGLSLVRHAVQRGKGTIELESALGQGSTFKVRLPLAQ